jgi:ABC-type branched-subunit amino acid transport system substrate-binding protein
VVRARLLPVLRPALAVALAAALTAGCGTTVRSTQEQATRGQSADGITPLGDPLPDARPSTDAAVQEQLALLQPEATPADGRLSGQPAAPALGASTRSAVRLGFFISDDASGIYKALGISGASHTRAESRAIWQAVIDQVNARGGLAGRRIVPSYYFIDSESGSNASRAAAACAQFTEDQKVFAVVLDGAGDRSLAACLAKHRTPAIDVGQTSYPYDDADLRELAPYLYLPGRLSMGRFATYVDTLAERGFFAKGSKVGLLRFDLPEQERTSRDVIAPALRRHGLDLAADVAFTPVEGTADLPRAADEASAAVLQLRGKGVDRVLFLGSGLSLPYVFPTVAESQGYRPTYGITTDDGPDFMATNAPAAQLTGAMAVGWEPQYDVPDSDAVLAGSPLWQQCAKVMKAAGFTARDGRRCTAIYFLEQALRDAAEPTAAAVRAGADRIGTRPYSTQTYRTLFAPGRYDGVGAVRPLRFDAACTCFRYLGGDRPV